MNENEPEELPHPWGFWLIVVLAVIYLGWRLIQGLLWLLGRLAG